MKKYMSAEELKYELHMLGKIFLYDTKNYVLGKDKIIKDVFEEIANNNPNSQKLAIEMSKFLENKYWKED